MSLSWIAEPKLPTWDEAKRRIVGEAPAGIFDARYKALGVGETVPGEWWRVERDGEVVGFGWLELVWGDAEILLATAPGARGAGVGGFALERLEEEAGRRGLNYLYNVVRPTHPDGEQVTAWLVKRGFTASEDGALRRRVGATAS
ncbi:MAG: GNAT family N-acetyltransferase [Planctomycetota bacterium]